MQVTIDIPDELAGRLSLERDRLAEIITRGLRNDWSGESALAEEVIDFLSRGPQPEAIVAFQPSKKSAGRIRELLGKNQRGELNSEEEAEVERISAVNNLFALIKAYARQHLQPAF